MSERPLPDPGTANDGAAEHEGPPVVTVPAGRPEHTYARRENLLLPLRFARRMSGWRDEPAGHAAPAAAAEPDDQRQRRARAATAGDNRRQRRAPDRRQRRQEATTNDGAGDHDRRAIGQGLRAMSIETREVRCAGCGSLLGKLAAGALTLRRGELQATFEGDFRASIVCYRTRCRRVTVLRIGAPPGGGGDGARPAPPNPSS